MTENEFFFFLTEHQDSIRVETAQMLATDLGLAFDPELIP